MVQVGGSKVDMEYILSKGHSENYSFLADPKVSVN